MIVLRIVVVKSRGTHLIDKPTINPLVKVGRLEIQRPESKTGGKEQDDGFQN